MKKLFSFIVVAALATSFASCGDSGKAADPTRDAFVADSTRAAFVTDSTANAAPSEAPTTQVDTPKVETVKKP